MSEAPGRKLSAVEIMRIANAAAATGAFELAEQRTLVDLLAHEFGPDYELPILPNPRLAAVTLVRVCAPLGTLPTFVDLVGGICGETTKWADLKALVLEILSTPPAPDFGRRLESALLAFPASALSDLLRSALWARDLPQVAGVGNALAAYRLIEDTPGSAARRAEVIFLELVAHGSATDDRVFLHTAITDLSQRYEMTATVRQTCDALTLGPTLDPGILSRSEQEAIDDGRIDPVGLGGPLSGDDMPAPTSVATSARPAVWGGVPPRNAGFAGRASVLEKVHANLLTSDRTTLVAQPMYGLGGVGKSQLATEYAYRWQHEYDLIWWVQADDDRGVRRSVQSLAKRLDIESSDDVNEVVNSVLDALRRGEPYRRWLLIFDNAPDPLSIQPYLPAGPGHVLITSRDRAWAANDQAIELDVFEPEESLAFLQAKWPNLSDDDARLLSEKLGHLPLGLDQAAALHRQTGMQLSEYLTALDSNPSIVMDEIPPGYRTSLAATLTTSFDELGRRSPAALQLLRLCVFLGSQPIAVPMLMRGRGADLPSPLKEAMRDDARVRMALRDLGRFSLAQIDAGRDLIRVHSLIGLFLRSGLTEEERVEAMANAHAVLGMANPGRPDDPINWSHLAQIAPHVVSSGIVYSENPDARRVALDEVRYFHAIGDYDASHDLGQMCREVWRGSLGVNDELTLLVSRHLAHALRALGRYTEARELNADTYERLVASVGLDNEHSLATAMSVAADLRFAGRFQQAVDLDEENLARYEMVFGANDPSTLRQAHNLAVSYRLIGRFQRAYELDEQTVRARAELLGEDHPRTLYSYASLVRDLYGLGKYQRGLALQRDKFRIQEQRLAPYHSDVMWARRNLAILWRKRGDYTKALEQAWANYDMCGRHFGRHHEHTLASLLALCNALRVTDNLRLAAEHGEEALRLFEEVFGQAHPFTLGCAVDVAIVWRQLGDLDRARETNEGALRELHDLLGPDHPYTLCASANRTNDLAAVGKNSEARELSEETYSRSLALRGEDHPVTLVCASNLVLDLDATAEAARANELRKETQARLLRVLGKEHPETLRLSIGMRGESDIELPAT